MKKQEGITLVALVITIIVLLILAMVSIKIALSGGLIEKTKEASDQHTIAVEKEAITTGYAAYQIELAQKGTATLTIEGNPSISTTEGGWTIGFKVNTYKLYNDGKVELLNGENDEDKDQSAAETELQNFIANPNNYVHPEQSADNKDRAIGTDGKAVNLDLWLIRITDEANGEIALSNSNGSTGNGPAYASKQLENGKIKGTIPQYIYVESNKKVYTVTGLISTFVGLDITESPIIPTTVTNMENTFNDCTKLIQAPTIPSSVTNMYSTFFRCTSLKQAPTIPSSVTNMTYTFSGCTSLVQAPTISSSVTNMTYTFEDCTSLVQVPTIPNSVTNMCGTFCRCTSLVQAPTIPNSATNMYVTFFSCTSLKQAPTIPSGVTNMYSTFRNCTSLNGNVRINSKNVNDICECFDGVNNNITVQVPANSTTYTLFKKEYGGRSNIKIETFE